MNFVQIEFAWFCAVLLGLYWSVRDRRWQNGVLLCGSAVFYGWVHPWFVALLAGSAVLDWSMARLMTSRPERRGLWLALSVAGNLGVLAYFKYFNFFVDSVLGLAAELGLQTDLRTLAIVLPVGVSFYTFQTLSYSIDVYRGTVTARDSLVDYAVYVGFFPQLVAGPIERAGHLLPQVEALRRFDGHRFMSGVSLALWGAFKKVCIADTLAPYVDKVFVHADPSGPLVWAACAAFSVQIYADFSGYTDIARGTARLLGFELVENFRAPWLAASTPEFWRRWHISLSEWVRDYLLVPLLGVGRIGPLRFLWAVGVAFFLLGMWHGASWNFALFGLFHGAAFAVYTGIGRVGPKVAWARPLGIAFHYVFVALPSCLLFRETHLDRLVQHLSKSPIAAPDDQWIAVSVIVGMTLLASTPLVIAHYLERWVLPELEESPWLRPLQTSGWTVMALAMFVLYRTGAADFVYFRF